MDDIRTLSLLTGLSFIFFSLGAALFTVGRAIKSDRNISESLMKRADNGIAFGFCVGLIAGALLLIFGCGLISALLKPEHRVYVVLVLVFLAFGALFALCVWYLGGLLAARARHRLDVYEQDKHGCASERV